MEQQQLAAMEQQRIASLEQQLAAMVQEVATLRARLHVSEAIAYGVWPWEHGTGSMQIPPPSPYRLASGLNHELAKAKANCDHHDRNESVTPCSRDVRIILS